MWPANRERSISQAAAEWFTLSLGRGLGEGDSDVRKPNNIIRKGLRACKFKLSSNHLTPAATISNTRRTPSSVPIAPSLN